MSYTTPLVDTYSALRSQIGKEFPPYTWVVEEGKVREFCRATRDDDPEVDGAHPPVPLTFSVSSVLWQGRDERFYRSLGFDMRYVLHGEQEFEYVRPLHIGEHLKAHLRLADVQRKVGRRGGDMVLVVLETEFHDEQGDTVLRAYHRIIQTGQEVGDGK